MRNDRNDDFIWTTEILYLLITFVATPWACWLASDQHQGDNMHLEECYKTMKRGSEARVWEHTVEFICLKKSKIILSGSFTSNLTLLSNYQTATRFIWINKIGKFRMQRLMFGSIWRNKGLLGFDMVFYYNFFLSSETRYIIFGMRKMNWGLFCLMNFIVEKITISSDLPLMTQTWLVVHQFIMFYGPKSNNSEWFDMIDNVNKFTDRDFTIT